MSKNERREVFVPGGPERLLQCAAFNDFDADTLLDWGSQLEQEAESRYDNPAAARNWADKLVAAAIYWEQIYAPKRT